MKLFKRFICRLFGHRFDVEGVTGRYEWCSRCALRRDNAKWRAALGEDGRVSAWSADMNSMIHALRPDLSDEWESLYHERANKMANFLDQHFSIAPDGWGIQNIALVPQIFRKRFIDAS